MREAMCLALDEAACGTCTRIVVTLHRDGAASVADDGPGLSLVPAPCGRPKAELLMTELFACRRQKASDVVARAACGVGIAVANALSEWCALATWYDGARWPQQYRQGKPFGPFARATGGDSNTRRTTLAFKPDEAVFARPAFEAVEFAGWLRGLAVEVDRATVTLADERTGEQVRG